MKLQVGDHVTLADHMRTIPSYEGKPIVHRSTILRVSAVPRRGAVTVTDGTYIWFIQPGDLTKKATL